MCRRAESLGLPLCIRDMAATAACMCMGVSSCLHGAHTTIRRMCEKNKQYNTSVTHADKLSRTVVYMGFCMVLRMPHVECSVHASQFSVGITSEMHTSARASASGRMTRALADAHCISMQICLPFPASPVRRQSLSIKLGHMQTRIGTHANTCTCIQLCHTTSYIHSCGTGCNMHNHTDDNKTHSRAQVHSCLFACLPCVLL